MTDQPFNRTPIWQLEKPVSTDINQGFGEADRSIRETMYRLLNGAQGFMGASLSCVPNSPAGLSVILKAGLGWQVGATDTPSNIGGALGLDDLHPYKPIVLGNDLVVNVPTPPGSNSRIDLIEVRYNRQLDNPQSRNFLQASSGSFAPAVVAKTLDFNVDASLSFLGPTDPAVTALIYRQGVAGASPTPPAVDTGYMALAYVTVASGATTIGSGQITDERSVITPAGNYNSGRYLGQQVIETGTTLYTPLGGTRARVRMVGGGGGAGGSAGMGSGSVACSGGRASGVYLEFYVGDGVTSITGGACHIGGGGAGEGAGTDGSPGGDTTLLINGTTYTAKGGGGSPHCAASAFNLMIIGNPGTRTAGSTFVTGMITAGDSGHLGVAGLISSTTAIVATSGGNGGSNPLGFGGLGGQSDGISGSSATPGAGGGGGGAASITTNASGGSGGFGLIIIEEWA